MLHPATSIARNRQHFAFWVEEEILRAGTHRAVRPFAVVALLQLNGSDLYTTQTSVHKPKRN